MANAIDYSCIRFIVTFHFDFSESCFSWRGLLSQLFSFSESALSARW